MLVVWYVWSRFFWFVTNEITPWPFIRYRLYQSFFNNFFTYNQLNFFQKKVINWFYIYLFFLPMSSNFANNYFFTLHRNYFGGLGYKFISYEGLTTSNNEFLMDLGTFSEEVFIIKKSGLLGQQSLELTVFLKYLTHKYYLSYFVYYLKAFYEFEPLNFRDITTFSPFLSTFLAYTTNTKISRFEIYNLNQSLDFFSYVRSVDSLNFFSTKPNLPTSASSDEIFTKFYTRLSNLKKSYTNNYRKLGVKNFFFGDLILTNVLKAKFNPSSYIIINPSWKAFLKNTLYIRFSESSVSKYISFNTIQNQKIYYIRKNRIFNKGRYSRNRQLYRTGFFWCVWLNVIAVYGLYFLFYRFMFNFGYLWFGVAFLAFSFIFARVCQARLYNVQTLLNEFVHFWNWLCVLFLNVYLYIYRIYTSVMSLLISFIYSNLFFKSILPKIYTSYLYKFFLTFSEETRKIKSSRFVFYWEYFVGEDKSFLKIKSKIHWLKQVWKMLVT